MPFFASVLAPGVALDLVCAGRRIRFDLSGRSALGALAGAVLAGALAAFGLFALLFGDLRPRMLAREDASIRAEYEERIVRLRNRVGELESRSAIDRTTIDAALRDLVARQARLETRHALLDRLAGEATSAARIDRRAEGPTSSSATARSDLDRASAFSPAGDRIATVDRLRLALDASEARQIDFIASVADGNIAGIERKTRALAELRLPRSVLPLPLPAERSGLGGPHVVVRDFDALYGAASAAIVEKSRLTELVRTLPLGRPVEGDPEVSSGFGVRTDPFTRRPAMHEGLDLRLDPGVPVRATGSGRVTAAGHSGAGYGLMVEVEHGHGLSTVYAHLSAVRVREGDAVEEGSVIGSSGNTGRSTGPHLHYETRIDGDAVDPVRFLRVGEKLRRP